MAHITQHLLFEPNLQTWADEQTNAALHDWQDVVIAEELTVLIDLPLHPCRPKVWDTYLALFHILRQANPAGPVLDAGAETYSALLPALRHLGYQSLVGINLRFEAAITVNGVTYEHGDITKTRFPDKSFAAITSLSVIEHGVDTSAFFHEAYRLLHPGGILFISFDYWPDPVDCRNQTMYGTPVKIFAREDWHRLLTEATEAGFLITEPQKPDCAHPMIYWEPTKLHYTFGNMLFHKPGTHSDRPTP